MFSLQNLPMTEYLIPFVGGQLNNTRIALQTSEVNIAMIQVTWKCTRGVRGQWYNLLYLIIFSLYKCITNKNQHFYYF